MQITPVTTPEAIATVASLATEVWTEFYTPIIGAAQVTYMLERFQSERAIAAQIAEGYRYFLLNDIGYFSLIGRQDRLFLNKIYLLASHRNRGLGRQMMEHVVSLARAEGYRAVELTVNKNNPSIAAYERLGFVNEGPTVADIGGGFVMDDYRMCLPL